MFAIYLAKLALLKEFIKQISKALKLAERTSFFQRSKQLKELVKCFQKQFSKNFNSKQHGWNGANQSNLEQFLKQRDAY